MTPYSEFLAEIKSYADEEYRNFHKKLLKNDKITVIGVRVPILKKIAKKHFCEFENIMTFPDEFYEVTFIKLSAASLLDYDDFIKVSDKCVGLIDNWATCDCFVPRCIKNHRDDYLPWIVKYAESGEEFKQRYALTTLLHFYIDEDYLETAFDIAQKCDTAKYYVHMAAAWLIAEGIVKYFSKTTQFLLENTLDKKTHNKAIQKACESFRLSDGEKNFLKGIKR